MLRPFSRFCVSIGAIPPSIIQSISYQEQLNRLIKFLRDTVIPAIEGNKEAIEAIEEWIETLDLQDEVDDKLDRMVEDGTMAEIINQEVFGEIQQDIADIEGDITDIEGDITDLDYKISKEEIITIGDSYGYTSGQFTYILKDIYINNTNKGVTSDKFHIWNESGASCVRRSGVNVRTYLEQLQYHASEISDPNKVTKIILAGGGNDKAFDYGTILYALQQLQAYCKTTYPNAKVYYGMLGWSKKSTSEGTTDRALLMSVVYNAYSTMARYGGIYMDGIECVTHEYNPSDWTGDEFHPTGALQQRIAEQIFNFLEGGGVSYWLNTSFNLNNGMAGAVYRTKNQTTIRFTPTHVGSLDVSLNSGNNVYTIGGVGSDIIRPVTSNDPQIEVNLEISGLAGATPTTIHQMGHLVYNENGWNIVFQNSVLDSMTGYTIRGFVTLDSHLC